MSNLGLKVTGLEALRDKINKVSRNLETTVMDAMLESANIIQQKWTQLATQEGMDTEYVASIEVIPEGKDGYYIGPSKFIAGTSTGIMDFEDVKQGDYISFIARCSVHKYYREVKREVQEDELSQFNMSDTIKDRLDEFYQVIRDTVRMRIKELLQ